jgi:signal transduction histidine kinase/HAMP domain-containing protein
MRYLKLSLQNKITYTILFFATLALGVVGYIGYSYTKDAYINHILNTEHNNINNVSLSIENKLSVMKQDATFIANFYAVQKLYNWEIIGVDDKIYRWEKTTKNTFKSLINLKKLYYKLRIIDLNGMEKISVFYDSSSKKALIQSSDKMQNRVDERYFKEALELLDGEVLVSQMELNMEFGKPVYPYVPIVHFSSLIYDKDGHKKGVAVINAYAETFLSSISDSCDYKSNGDLNKSRYMIDHKGFFLFHQDSSKEWGEQLSTDERFQKYYPEVFEVLKREESGYYEFDNKIFTYKRVYPDLKKRDEYWILINEVDSDSIFTQLIMFEKLFFGILLFTVLILFYIIKKYLNNILIPLSKVTQQLKALSNGQIKNTKIEYNSEDEVKELIDSTQKLITNINRTIEQAKNVANGDFTQRVKAESKDDALANSINEMTDKLDSIAYLAKSLSEGDFSKKVIVLGEKDRLNIALNGLLDYFRGITKVAESISKGNFEVEFNKASSKDRLGIAINDMINTLNQIVSQANKIAQGDFSENIVAKSSQDRLGFALAKMTKTLKDNSEKSGVDIWLKDGLSRLSSELSAGEDLKSITDDAVATIVKHIDASCGVFFIYSEDKKELSLQSSYAFVNRKSLANHFKEGEGVIGQVLLEQKPILLTDVEDFIIESGIVSQKPLNSYTFPIIYEGIMIGVMEIASFSKFREVDKEFISKASNIAASFIYNVMQNRKIKKLLEDSQIAYEELQVKSEELQQSNVQMEEQQQQLEIQSTDLKNKNAMLEKSKQELDKRALELEKSSQYKSEFLANMSHELRTPLNSIILLSKMLTESKSDNISIEDIKKAKVIHKSGQDLLLLINDILDLSKIESGNMELVKEDINTQELLSDIKDLFEPVANESGVEFIIDDNLNSTIYTDRLKLVQIIKNLLSNAFKFTKKGKVTLSLNYHKSLQLPIVISVKDTGIGIPNDKKEMIFDAFKQVDGSISREYGGTGLGLSISKKFCEALGGKIEVDSKKDIGSEFIIYLPTNDNNGNKIDKSSYPKDEVKATQNSNNITEESLEFFKELKLDKESKDINDGFLKDKKILITDDDSRNIFSLSALLQKEGATTLYALNGKEAIEILNKESVDLVLMDIMMPEMDGYSTIENIREDKRFKELPIIAVTAKAMKDDRDRCLEVGANDYLSKPIDSKSLLMMIKAWIDRQ